MIFLRTKSSMQNCKEPSSFFTKGTGASQGEEEGLLAPTSNGSSTYYFTNNNSYGLCWYSPFCIGSVPHSSIIECISPSFLFGGTYFGSYPGNTSWYLHSKSHSGPQCSGDTPSKWGTAPSRISLSQYKTSWRNTTGLFNIFNYSSYFTVLPFYIPPGRSQFTIPTLAGGF